MSVASMLAGCGSAHHGHRFTVTVAPGPVAFDSTLTLTVSGARTGTPVAITATVTDAKQVRWHSSASFTPTSDGRVDVSGAAPLPGGSYQGARANTSSPT